MGEETSLLYQKKRIPQPSPERNKKYNLRSSIFPANNSPYHTLNYFKGVQNSVPLHNEIISTQKQPLKVLLGR